MIKQVVAKTVKSAQTEDPFEIIRVLNIINLFEPLGEIYGYFSNYKRVPIIHINESLPEHLRKFTCAHELAHRILHPRINVPFLKSSTLHSIEKIEKQANQFAVELLIPDSIIFEGATIYEAATICGVPHEVAHLKRIETNF